jgi:hypothetical protein
MYFEGENSVSKKYQGFVHIPQIDIITNLSHSIDIINNKI